MTQQTAGGTVPALTLGWRLKMSLDQAGVSVQAMADQLGVTRATLSRWMSDRGARPKKAYLSQWALATGVPFDWLDTGRTPPATDPDGDGSEAQPMGPRPTPEYHHLPRVRLFHLPAELVACAQSAGAVIPNLPYRAPLARVA